MRTATLSALMAATALLCLGADDPQQPRQPASRNTDTGAPANRSGAPGAAETLKVTAPPPGPAAKAASLPPSDKSYVIGPEDVLDILVWNSVPLSGKQPVRPDGRITVPLVGELIAAGKTPEELRLEIVEKLKTGDIIKAPDVAVGVFQVNSKKYFVQGEVFKPDAYILNAQTTVLEALIKAGGFRDFAKKSKIRVLRGKQTFFFNYNQVSKNQHTEQNILLQPGDIIVVP